MEPATAADEDRPGASTPAEANDVSEAVGVTPRLTPIDDFVAAFKKPLEPPLITSTPLLRKTRPRKPTPVPGDEDWIPKRSIRLAAKSAHREPRPEAQARKVMLKRIGLEIDTEHPDEASFDEFHTAFKLPLPEETKEAMRALFPGRKQRVLRTVSAA
jgi:hypothetical protein